MQPFCHKVAITRTKEFLELTKQYTNSLHLISEAWQVYHQYRDDCKKAVSADEIKLSEYLAKLTDLLELAKDIGPDMRDKDSRAVYDIIELLRHDADSHMFTYVKGKENV